MRVILEPAFVLHTKPFRDTSLFVDLFTLNHGRVRVIAKGARRIKSPLHELLAYFTPLLVSWSGKGDLPTLTKVERVGASNVLQRKSLFYGMYVNELLWRLLEERVSYAKIHKAYSRLLVYLVQEKNVEATLELFKKILLAEVGYGVTLNKDMDGNPILSDNYYSFVESFGLRRLGKIIRGHGNCFEGRHLLSLHNNSLNNNEEIAVAGSFLNLVLAPLVKGKLKSVELLG